MYGQGARKKLLELWFALDSANNNKHSVCNDSGYAMGLPQPETWLKKEDAAVKAKLCPDEFKFLDHPHNGRRGGGTGLLYRDSLQVKVLESAEKEPFEFSEWIVTSSSSHSLRVVNIYRPPYSEEHRVTTSVFFTEFANCFEAFLLCKEQLLITCDFNIHMDAVDQPDTRRFLDLMESLGLKQHVTQPTHVDGHILDLIITRLSDNIIKDPPYVSRFVSDYASILCNLLHVKPALTAKKITYRKIKSVNLESLRSDLSAPALCSDPSRNQVAGLDEPVRN